MKVIIAGSRDITDYKVVERAIAESGFLITEVVSGTARGVDRLGEKFAIGKGLKISRFPADWDLFGRSAGYRRNRQMATYADALIAIWDGKSPGTRSMIQIARKKDLKIFVYKVEEK